MTLDCALRCFAGVTPRILSRSLCPTRAERISRVAYCEQHDSVASRDAQALLERTYGIVEILDHVVGDHEVHRLLSKAVQRVVVVDHSAGGGGGRVRFAAVDRVVGVRDLVSALWAVYVSHSSTGRDAEWSCPAADLRSIAREVAAGKILP